MLSVRLIILIAYSRSSFYFIEVYSILLSEYVAHLFIHFTLDECLICFRCLAVLYNICSGSLNACLRTAGISYACVYVKLWTILLISFPKWIYFLTVYGAFSCSTWFSAFDRTKTMLVTYFSFFNYFMDVCQYLIVFNGICLLLLLISIHMLCIYITSVRILGIMPTYW